MKSFRPAVFSAAFVFFSFVVFPCFFSCASSAHLPVPGEREAKRSSIYSEYMAIADAYNDLEKYDKAAEYYSLARKSRKLYWTASYKLGRCYALNKKYADALEIYEALLSRDKENLGLKMSVAYLQAMSGEVSKAEKTYSELWEENPGSADVLVNFISVLFAAENYTEAEAKTALLKEKFPDNKNISGFEKKLEEHKSSLEPDSDKSSVESSEESSGEVKSGEKSD